MSCVNFGGVDRVIYLVFVLKLRYKNKLSSIFLTSFMAWTYPYGLLVWLKDENRTFKLVNERFYSISFYIPRYSCSSYMVPENTVSHRFSGFWFRSCGLFYIFWPMSLLKFRSCMTNAFSNNKKVGKHFTPSITIDVTKIQHWLRGEWSGNISIGIR